MVEQLDVLRCLKCGYALVGLPARKCGDCGHVYLRCPECGTSQIANEAQNRLLLQMRARAAKLPGRIQGSQIIFLVMLGTLWVVLGFAGGAASRDMQLTGHLVMAGVAALSACLVRLLVFRLKSPWLASGSAMAFLMGAFAVGSLCAWGTEHVRIVHLLALGAYVATGAEIGGLGAEVIGWTILWLFAKDQDRVILTAAYRGALGERLLKGDVTRATRQLMYCTHCAAELPALMPNPCSDCGLQQVTCPTCGRHCGVSDALSAMLNVARATQGISAGIWVVVRALLATFMWIWLVSIVAQMVGYNVGPRGRATGSFPRIVMDPNFVVPVLILAAGLTWSVFMRGAVSRALLCMGMALTAGWFIAEIRPRSYAAPWTWVLLLAIGVGAASLLASFLAVLVQASLPRRRVAMLEEVVPELARQEAQS